MYIRELNLDPVNARGRGRRRGSTSTTEEHEMSPKKNEDSCNGFDSTFTHQDWLNFLQNKLLGCISWTMVRRPSSLFYISTSKWRPKVEHLKKKKQQRINCRFALDRTWKTKLISACILQCHQQNGNFKIGKIQIYRSSCSCVLLFLFTGEIGSNILMAGHLSAVLMTFTFTVHFQLQCFHFDSGDHKRLIAVFVLFTLPAGGSPQSLKHIPYELWVDVIIGFLQAACHQK